VPAQSAGTSTQQRREEFIMNTRIAKGAVVASMLFALVAVPVGAGASARPATTKSISVTLHAHIGANHPTSGVQHGHGTLQGSLSGTYTATVDVPVTKYVLEVSGGTIDITTLYNVDGEKLSGAWHTTGGSGRYAHVKGSGKATGALAANAVFKLTGKLSY
jgi:hypothetical protein